METFKSSFSCGFYSPLPIINFCLGYFSPDKCIKNHPTGKKCLFLYKINKEDPLNSKVQMCNQLQGSLIANIAHMTHVRNAANDNKERLAVCF